MKFQTLLKINIHSLFWFFFFFFFGLPEVNGIEFIILEHQCERKDKNIDPMFFTLTVKLPEKIGRKKM